MYRPCGLPLSSSVDLPGCLCQRAGRRAATGSAPLSNPPVHCLAAADRALNQVHPAGGLVPRLLLLVQRRYPLLYWCRSRKHFITPKALAAAQQREERQQEQVGDCSAAGYAIVRAMRYLETWAWRGAASTQCVQWQPMSYSLPSKFPRMADRVQAAGSVTS